MQGPIAIVLAAGKGTRMKSELPKVLCQACGRPLIDYVLDSLTAAGIKHLFVVIGYRGELVREALSSRPNVTFVEQTEQLGTGHAVKVCEPALKDYSGTAMVVAGDSPMIQVSSIKSLLEEFEKSKPACLLGTLKKDNPFGLGRIVRDSAGKFIGIVEEKDATDEQRKITEVNMSTYLFEAGELFHALSQLRNDNRQKEFYLTDCPTILLKESKDVRAIPVLKPIEALSVNTVDELVLVEAALKEQTNS